ncbi:MAG: hypothetical protein R3F02_05630 [Thiolinea sp.]
MNTLPLTHLLRGVMLLMAAAFWVAFLVMPLVSSTVAAYHGVDVHGMAGNLIYTLIGLNYIGGLYALHFLNLTLPFIWVFGWLLMLALWY